MTTNWQPLGATQFGDADVDFQVIVEVSEETTYDRSSAPTRTVRAGIVRVEEAEDGEIPFLVTECMEAAVDAVWQVVRRHYGMASPGTETGNERPG